MNELIYRGTVNLRLPEAEALVPDLDGEIWYPGVYWSAEGSRFGDRNASFAMTFREMLVAEEMPAYRDIIQRDRRIPASQFLDAMADVSIFNALVANDMPPEDVPLWPHLHLPLVSHIDSAAAYAHLKTLAVQHETPMELEYKHVLWADVVTGSVTKKELVAYFDNMDVPDCEPKGQRVLTLDEMKALHPIVVGAESQNIAVEIVSSELEAGIRNLLVETRRFGANLLKADNFASWPIPHIKLKSGPQV